MIHFQWSDGKLKVTSHGFGGIFLLLVFVVSLFAVPRILSPQFTSEDAKAQVRQFMEWNVYQEDIKQMGGEKTPDPAMAQKWQRQIAEVKKIEILSVEVKRGFFSMFSFHPSYIIKTKIRDPSQKVEERYFLTMQQMVIRETTSADWTFAF